MSDKLTKVAKFYIELNLEKSPKQLSKDTGVDLDTVNKFIKKTKRANEKLLKNKDISNTVATVVNDAQPSPIVNNPPALPTIRDTFINKTSGQNKGVSIMTETAATRSDELKNVPTKNPYHNIIYKIRPEEGTQ